MMIKQQGICWNCGQDAIVDEDFICGNCQSKADDSVRYGGNFMPNLGKVNECEDILRICKHTKPVFYPMKGVITKCRLKWNSTQNDYQDCDLDYFGECSKFERMV